MTLISAGGTDQRLRNEFSENRSTVGIQEQLDLEHIGTDADFVQKEQLCFEENPVLTGNSAKTQRKCPSHDRTIPRTSRQSNGVFLKHDVVLFSCDEECKTPTHARLNSEVVKEGDKKPRPKTPSKVDETELTPPVVRTQTQEEKMLERSRKGRERSLRTRRRNVARLKLLEENCVHISRENEILRDLARSLAGQDDEKTAKLFNEYRLIRSCKPEAHKLMHPESYYLNLLSPLSVKASANAEDTHSNTQKVLESSLEHSMTPQPCRSGNGSFNGKSDLARQEVIASTSKASAQVDLNRSKSDEHAVLSVINNSVFADPAYGDGKQFVFSVEEVCDQPLLSAEEIVDLVEQGARGLDLPSLR